MKIGVIIQGPTHEDSIKLTLKKSLEFLTKHFDKDSIVISTCSKGQILNDIGINYVVHDSNSYLNSEKFDILNVSNIFRQSNSVKFGLDYLEARGFTHAIKIRTDEYYRGYGKLLERLRNTDKIICSNMICSVAMPFHIGDHLIAGEISKLKMMFGSIVRPIKLSFIKNDGFYKSFKEAELINKQLGFKRRKLQFNELNVEPVLALSYLNNLENNIGPEMNRYVFDKYFDIFNVLEFDDFYCISNNLNFCINKNGFKLLINPETRYEALSNLVDKDNKILTDMAYSYFGEIAMSNDDIRPLSGYDSDLFVARCAYWGLVGGNSENKK